MNTLNLPLEHVNVTNRYALEEKSVIPDHPILKAYLTCNGIPPPSGRGGLRTFFPVLCGDESVTAALILQRTLSVPIDAVNSTGKNDVRIAANENLRQSAES